MWSSTCEGMLRRVVLRFHHLCGQGNVSCALICMHTHSKAAKMQVCSGSPARMRVRATGSGVSMRATGPFAARAHDCAPAMRVDRWLEVGSMVAINQDGHPCCPCSGGAARLFIRRRFLFEGGLRRVSFSRNELCLAHASFDVGAGRGAEGGQRGHGSG